MRKNNFIAESCFIENRTDRSFNAILLDFDAQNHTPINEPQQLTELWDFLRGETRVKPAASIERAKFVIGVLVEATLAVGGSLQGLIVNGHHAAIA